MPGQFMHGREVIDLGLTNPSSGLQVDNASGTGGTQATHQYTIENDDQAVISAGDDGTVRRWPLDTKVLPHKPIRFAVSRWFLPLPGKHASRLGPPQ